MIHNLPNLKVRRQTLNRPPLGICRWKGPEWAAPPWTVVLVGLAQILDGLVSVLSIGNLISFLSDRIIWKFYTHAPDPEGEGIDA